MTPKQRSGSGSGKWGGDRHRSNIGAFRNAGGHVSPPKKGCFDSCALVLIVGLGAGALGLYGLIDLFL